MRSIHAGRHDDGRRFRRHAKHLALRWSRPVGSRHAAFLVRRLVLAILVCLTVLVVSFALTRLSGDIAISIAGPNATPEDVAIIRKNYGFDRPLPVQFLDWAVHAARGRSRTFLSVPRVGRRADQGAAADHADAWADRSVHRAGRRPFRSASSRRCARDAAGPGDRAGRAVRPGDAELLAGAGADHLVRPKLQLLPISGVDEWQGYILPGSCWRSPPFPR